MRYQARMKYQFEGHEFARAVDLAEYLLNHGYTSAPKEHFTSKFLMVRFTISRYKKERKNICPIQKTIDYFNSAKYFRSNLYKDQFKDVNKENEIRASLIKVDFIRMKLPTIEFQEKQF
jgi:hypothetical protein